MLATHKKKTNIGVGVGVVLQLGGRALMGSDGSTATFVGGLVFVTGLAVFLWGCAMYAEGKGHDPIWGFLGLLSIIGLLILMAKPDLHPEGKPGPQAAVPPPPPSPANRSAK